MTPDFRFAERAGLHHCEVARGGAEDGVEFEGVAVRLPGFVDATEPSPLAHEILNGRPYTFLDDAPLEERRTRAVVLRRGLPVEARELAKLDPEAIERVRKLDT